MSKIDIKYGDLSTIGYLCSSANNVIYLSLQNKMQCDGNKNSTPVIQDSRYRGAGESPRKPLDFLKNEKHMYKHHQREISMV